MRISKISEYYSIRICEYGCRCIQIPTKWKMLSFFIKITSAFVKIVKNWTINWLLPILTHRTKYKHIICVFISSILMQNFQKLVLRKQKRMQISKIIELFVFSYANTNICYIQILGKPNLTRPSTVHATSFSLLLLHSHYNLDLYSAM